MQCPATIVRWRFVVLMLFAAGIIGAPTAARGATNTTFFNPIKQGESPDPWMTYYNGNYYFTYTAGDSIRVSKAPTLAGLNTAPEAVVWSDTTTARCCQIWAPEFHLLNGPNGMRWYLYYTADDGNDSNHRIYVLESAGTDPLGPYTFKARVYDIANDVWAIDPSILQKANGALYMLWSGPGNLLYIAAMSNPWTMSGSRTYLPADGFGCSEVREAPEILKHNSDIFLVYSACDTGKPDYRLGILKANESSNLLNASAWTQLVGPAFQRNDANNVFGPGHNGFFKSPDGTEDWIVYHGKTTSNYTYAGRNARAQKIAWNADGTPNLGTPASLGTALAAPAGEAATTHGYEAEFAQLSNARVVNVGSASHGQKVGTIDYADSAVTFSVRVPKAGTYAMVVRYANGWGDSSHTVSVNGGIPFSIGYANNGVDVWTSVTAQVALDAGVNTIRFTKGRNFTELDYIDLPRYEAEYAELTNASAVQVDGASSGQKVGYIDYADSAVRFRVEVPNGGTYTLRVVYANGWGASSHNVSVNSGGAFAINYANNGINAWTVATATVNLNAGMNTITFAKGNNYSELDYIEVYQ